MPGHPSRPDLSHSNCQPESQTSFNHRGLLLFTLPFTGATVFSKSPLIKTVFVAALIFFGNLFLVYFFLEIMGFSQYHPNEPILFIRHMEDGLLTCIVGTIIFNAGFVAAAYFKLKEREV